MVKKGYLKTIEVLLAITITAVLIFYIIPVNYNRTNDEKHILETFKYDQNFRSFILKNKGCYKSFNATLINILLESQIPDQLGYEVCIDDKAYDLPNKDVEIDSRFFAGNESELNFKVVRLYLWSN